MEREVEEKSEWDFVQRRFGEILVDNHLPWLDSLFIRHTFDLVAVEAHEPMETPFLCDEQLSAIGYKVDGITGMVSQETQAIFKKKGLEIEGVGKMRRDLGIDDRFQYPGD